MSDERPNLDSPRRRQLLEAAGTLFRARGFRGVTMEAIASEARVAKATLYSHFPDKTAIFAAVADYVTNLIAETMAGELAGTGSTDQRLLRALIARHQKIFEVVDGSPHARELMSARDAYARASVEKIDKQMIDALVAALQSDASYAASAPAIAHTLFRGCVGVSGGARSSSDLAVEIEKFVRPYLVGVRALAEGGAAFDAKSQERSAPELRRAAGSGRK